MLMLCKARPPLFLRGAKKITIKSRLSDQRRGKADSLGAAFPPTRGRSRIRDDGTQIPRLRVLAHRQRLHRHAVG